MELHLAEVRFQETWERLAEQGKCDGFGGMEYRRVRKEWAAAGKPADVEAFIIERANIGPEK
jgi:hypothetical protein